MIEHIEVKDFTVFELTTENAKKWKKELDAISGFGDCRRPFPHLYLSGVDEKRWADGILVRNKGLGVLDLQLSICNYNIQTYIFAFMKREQNEQKKIQDH